MEAHSLLDSLDVAQFGSGVLGSALCMDKAKTAYLAKPRIADARF